MSLENFQTGLESLDTFKLDELLEESKYQNNTKQYKINSNVHWVSNEVATSFNSAEYMVESKPSSLPDSQEIQVDETNNNSIQDAQLFETVSFFNTFGGTWSQPGGKGNPVNVTYSFSNLLDGSIRGMSNTDIKSAIQEAFGVWSKYAPLNFTEVQDSSRNSQMMSILGACSLVMNNLPFCRINRPSLLLITVLLLLN